MGTEKQLRDYAAHSLVSLEQFFQLSISITEMVYYEHRQNVVIGNLSAINIVIRENSQGLKARLSSNPEAGEAYHSPEQSGKINRIPDERSDLYSLGVVLYELLTGQLPLQPEPGETWENAHIYRMPAPLADIRPDAGGLLEAIVMKLLAKPPEARYQSAYGLLDDLQQCERIGQASRELPFELGRRDRLHSLRLADSWHGYSAELEQLAAGLNQALQGKHAFRLVVGMKGTGKTTLVHQLQGKAVRSGGWFIEGGSVRQALRQGIEQLWSEPAEVVALLKGKLQAAFTQDEARAVVSLLPEAAPLLPETVLLPGAADGSERTGTINNGAVFVNFIRCLAAIRPPLVLFIDDLEQADSDTYEVLRLLTAGDGIGGLLLIGAYRTETEQQADRLLPDGVVRSSDQVLLRPLSYEELRLTIAAAMFEPEARLSLLAQAIYERTAGNMQAIHTLLESWIQDKLLVFDDRRHRWTWDQELTESMNGSELHRRLIEESLRKISTETKELLAAAAVIGLTFQPRFLAEVCGVSLEQVLSLLQEAEEQEIVFAEGEMQRNHNGEISYLFQNHVVHQALYDAGGEKKVYLHRKIGLLLQHQQKVDKPKQESQPVIEPGAIDHLNFASEILNAEEVRQLRTSNLHVGKQALEEGRFAKAKQYAEAGLKLARRQASVKSGADSLYVQLKLLLVWAEYMLGNLKQTKKLLDDLNEQRSKLGKADRVQVWTALIRFYTATDNAAAIQYGKEALAEYGWTLRDRPSKFLLFREVMRTRLLLQQYRNKIEYLPINRDEDYMALSGLLEQALFPLLIDNPEALIDLYARFIRYGLRKGMNEALACVIGVYEQLLYRILPQYVPLIPFTKLASLQRFDGVRPSFNSQIEFLGAVSKQMDYPLESSVSIVKSIRRGLELNDTDFASFAMITFLVTYSGDIQSLSNVLDFFDSHMRNKTSDMVLQLIEDTRSYVKALQNESELRRFIAIPEAHRSNSTLPDESNYSCGCKLEAAFLAGHYREALYWAHHGRITELGADWIRVRKQRIYEMLARIALYSERSAAEQKQICKDLRSQLDKMKKWKGFLGFKSAAYLLLRAEWKRITAAPMDALREYMAAIKQARDDKHGLMEGIACERLALCYKEDLVSRSGAMIAMMDACTAYSLYGITFKAVQIRLEHADLMQPMSSIYEGRVLEVKPINEANRLPHPEAEIAGKAAGRIAKEAKASSGKGEAQEAQSAEALWRIIDSIGKLDKQNWGMSLLEATLQQAGADRAVLLRHADGEFEIKAQLDMAADRHRQIDESAANLYADSILRHTAVTKQALVLGDAVHSYFVKDRYIREYSPRSILCMPLAIPGDQQGILLYLENTAISDVFTEQDVKILELIATKIIYSTLLEDGDTLLDSLEAAETRPPIEAIEGQSLVDPLTGRELEILRALAEGLSNRDIAQRFGIAETTVKTHTSRIFGKLGAKRRGQAVARAKELQLLD